MEEKTPVKLAYSTFKSKHGENSNLSPVIFLHGLTSNKELWENIPQMIAERTKRICYTVDARNHGDSKFTDIYDPGSNLVDLLYFLTTVQAEKVILVGNSMGGLTAMETALREPNRVEKMIAIEPASKKYNKSTVDTFIASICSWITAMNQLPKNIPFEEAAERIADSIFNNLPPNNLMKTSVKTKRSVANSIVQNPDGTYSAKCNLVAILEGFKKRSPLQTNDFRGRFDGQAVFIFGELSPIRVDTEEAIIRKHFSNAEIIEFKSAIHEIVYEFRELLLETLIKFLAQ